MRIIGITGGIGTGKSTVLHLLEEIYGACIVEADQLAHRLMEPGQSAYREIVKVFGTGILCEDGKIDRRTLGNIVFQDEKALNRLNEIVHPAVKKYILEDIRKKTDEQVSLYIIEAALLIEDGYKEICDELWYIYVEKEERIKRLLHGRGGDREKWERVINSQSSEEYYRLHCDAVINNGKDLKATTDIVKELLSKMR